MASSEVVGGNCFSEEFIIFDTSSEVQEFKCFNEISTALSFLKGCQTHCFQMNPIVMSFHPNSPFSSPFLFIAMSCFKFGD